MSIYADRETTKVRIGYGDTYIATAIGATTGRGIVGFGQATQEDMNAQDLPVQLTFKTPESVQALVNYLEHIKKAMEKQNKGDEE
jgi:PII-like signaling protein